MADPTVWTRSIPYIRDGQPVKASVPNAPLQVLADRTAALKAMIDAIESGEQLVLRNAPVASSISEGNVVYFNPTTLLHDNALAKWEATIPATGIPVLSETALYTGVIIAKTGSQSADILVSGFATISSAAQTVLFDGVSPEIGAYYLSMQTAGTVQKTAPLLALRTLQWMGSGIIRVLTPQIEGLSHTHHNYTLFADEWLDVSFFDPSIVPDGAIRGYNFQASTSIAQNLSDVLLPYTGEPSFIYRYEDSGESSSSASMCVEGGLHLDDTFVILDSNGIWWFQGTDPACDMELVVTMADSKGLSILNSIISQSPEFLEVVTTNGRVEITFLSYEEEADVTGYTVVKELSGNKQRRGPVVESVRVGTGLRRSSDAGNGKGNVYVELVMFSDMMINASIQNLNNAVTAVDSPYAYTIFPTNRNSTVTCCVLLPEFSSLEYEMTIWAQFLAPDPSQDGPSLTVVRIPTPSTAGVVPGAEVVSAFNDFPGTIASNKVYLLEGPVSFSLSGYSRGTVFYTIGADLPTKELRMLNTGVKLVAI